LRHSNRCSGIAQ